jgi:uncharacterized protein YkwD
LIFRRIYVIIFGLIMFLRPMTFRDFYLSVLLAAVAIAALFAATTQAETVAQRLSGKILLQVEAKGEAWYVNPETKERYFLGRPADAFEVMRSLGLGIKNSDIANIPEARSSHKGDAALRKRLSGKILLQVEEKGEAWYVNPETMSRHYLGRPEDAFAVMRELGLGISDMDLISIPISSDSAPVNTLQEVNLETHLNDGRDEKRLALLNAINTERLAQGLPIYLMAHDLSDAAQNHVDDMLARNYFEFVSPDGRDAGDWSKEAGYDAHIIAENIAKTNGTEAGLVSTWKEQQDSSYQNVIHPNYEHVGVGVKEQDGLTVYSVMFGLSLQTHFEKETAALSDLEAVRDQMLVLLNEVRADAGVSPLSMNSLLAISAQGHADDMFNRAYYSHESPEGASAWERINATGYKPQITAENIAKNQLSVEVVMQSWMESEKHRVNLLAPDFTEVGFGLSYGLASDGYSVLWVQNFARPRS